MSLVTPDKVPFYWPNLSGAGSDGAALAEYTADAGSDAGNIVDSALTQADDYWNDCIIKMTGGSNDGLFGHVKDFTAADDTLELARSFAAAVGAGDTFNILPVGTLCNSAFRSSEEIVGMEASSDWTNLNGAGTFVTAVVNAAVLSGEGTAQIFFDQSEDTMAFKAPGDSNFGESVDISAGDGTYTLWGEADANGDVNNWIKITIDYSEAPAADATDDVTLSLIDEGALIPDGEPWQLASGLVRYILLPFKNTDASNTLEDLRAWVEPQADASTTITTATVATDATEMAVTDASGMPSKAFWLYNSDEDDCTYVKYRTGNTLYIADRSGNLRGKTATAWASGDNVQVWTNIDIAKADVDGSDQFPADITALTYSATEDYSYASGDHSGGLSWGSFAASGIAGIVVRETILDVAYPISNLISQIRLRWH